MNSTRANTRHKAHLTNAVGLLALAGVSSWSLAAGLVLFDFARQPENEKPTTKTDGCLAAGCHTEVREHETVHEPVLMDACLRCHTYSNPETHEFVYRKVRNELCLDCHQTRPNRSNHEPYAEGDCMSCHAPHGSDFAGLLTADPMRDLCTTCHESPYLDQEFVHGPVAIGACVVCHDSHSASHDHLLKKDSEDLCYDCHDRVRPKSVVGRMVHQPLEEGCESCHDPHASHERYQLKAGVPELCLSCHEHIEKTLAREGTTHGPVLDESGCVQCHSPHDSTHDHLLKWTQPKLCLTCHDETLTTEDGRELTNMAKLLDENPIQHGPIRQGGCAVCHSAHAAPHANLLTSPYPPEFYAKFEVGLYELCFSCHMPELATEPKGQGITGFRRGKENLHYLHVNLEKGRTCRACHEVHASDQPFHIRDSVPFGSTGWELEIRFSKTNDGGSCAPGCHKPRTYDRTEPTPASAAAGSDDESNAPTSEGRP